MEKLKNISGVIFDLDGTLYLGEQALPGAVETCRLLRESGKKLIFLSNKPLQGRDIYADKLTRLGIPATSTDVITSTHVLGLFLKRTAPDQKLYVIGEENTRSELRSHGLAVISETLDQDPLEVIDPTGIDAVVVAFDRTLDYRKLNTAYQAIMSGAHFYATNADKTCPMPGGGIPDAGATIKALEHITGRQVEFVAGKPSSLMLEEACAYLQIPVEHCVMVGDRLETDIWMGTQAGMHTALVLTGATCRHDLDRSEIKPDIVIERISDLLTYI